MKSRIILGIDTSCYTTSIAAINLNGQIIYQNKIMLSVKDGEKGLRQSDGIFQHMMNFGEIFKTFPENLEITAVCASSKPRNKEGSYMPVFSFGYNWGKSLSDLKKIPFYQTTHQDGHIEAGKYDTNLDSKKFIAIHISGGTTEILLVEDEQIQIIGGTKDISAGQIIDRIGVKLGYKFPAGRYVDDLAINSEVSRYKKPKISVFQSWINLSGLETQLYKMIDRGEYKDEIICQILMNSLKESIFKAVKNACEEYLVDKVLFIGGVSSSLYLKQNLYSEFEKIKIKSYWPKPEFAKDNGAGCAIIGYKNYKSEGDFYET